MVGSNGFGQKVRDRMERLTQTSDRGGVAFTFDLYINCMPSEAEKILKIAEKLKSYEDAEEQGLLLRLPCKVGDKVYVIVGKNISEQKIQRVTIDSEWKIEFCTRKRGFALFDIGKTVFLTREEAKLKEMEENHEGE